MKLAQFIERHPYRFVAIMEAVVVIAHRRPDRRVFHASHRQRHDRNFGRGAHGRFHRMVRLRRDEPSQAGGEMIQRR